MEKTYLFDTAAIYGVGLIGGSLARVLKNRGLAKKVIGVGRSKANMDNALKLGIIDEVLSPEDAAKEADLVVLCGPVLTIVPTLEKIAPFLPDGALVTDAGSTKEEIVSGIEKIADKRFVFIGSHPIAGTEKSGAEASFETLFDGKKCILTPSPNAPEKQLSLLKSLWKGAGMTLVEMTPEKHDRIFSAVSHLPHMVVYALVNAISELRDDDELIKFAAGGFKDFTRIASSSPEMWADVAITNPGPLAKHIKMVISQLEKIETAINEGNREELSRIFVKSNIFRGKLV